MPIVFGNSNLVREYSRQLSLLATGGAALGAGKGVPTIIGELGIPFDFNEGDAYRTGDFRLQISAMDTTLQALDKALLSATLWNYTPDNSNKYGDGWNGEDLSIFSPDQIQASLLVQISFFSLCTSTPTVGRSMDSMYLVPRESGYLLTRSSFHIKSWNIFVGHSLSEHRPIAETFCNNQ